MAMTLEQAKRDAVHKSTSISGYANYMLRHIAEYGERPEYTETTLRESYYNKNIKVIGFAKVLYGGNGGLEPYAYYNEDSGEVIEWDGREYGKVLLLKCTLEEWKRYKQPMPISIYLYG